MTQEEFHKRYQYNPNTDCLGEGGFGKVFKAYDTHRDRWVAIKMAEVKPQLEEVRLKKEVEMIKKLPTHPNIAYYEECYTFSTFAGEYDFGILQYYELGNMQQLLTANQLTDGQKDSLLRQILEGIGFLHSQEIIHRDIKPQNILIVNRNGEYVPKITDFGISKKLDTNKSSVFTNSLAGAGTLAYASPEQLCGQTIKKNTDLWSFGVIAYWIFFGKLPFNTGDMTVTSEAGRIELFKQIIKGEIPELIKKINSPWKELIQKCLVPNNEKRVSNINDCQILLGKKVFFIQEHTKILEYFDSKPEVVECIKDIDGNEYHAVKIGSQIWMIENLETTRYQNGDLIGTTISPTLNISGEKAPKYQWKFDHDKKNIKTGRLYTWYAATDPRNIAPKGWRVPNNKDWNELQKFLILNGFNYDGSIKGNKISKSLAAKVNWRSSKSFGAIGNDLTINNRTGFTALPSFSRYNEGTFNDWCDCRWWSSTENSKRHAWCRYLNSDEESLKLSRFCKDHACNIRCIKEN